MGVAVAGSYAYVADEDGGLRVINVANPAAPAEVGPTTRRVRLRRGGGGQLRLRGRRYGGLRVINVANPAVPAEVGAYDTPGAAYGVAVAGSYAYVADYGRGLRVINVANPAAPAEVGFYDTPGIAYGVAVAGATPTWPTMPVGCG